MTIFLFPRPPIAPHLAKSSAEYFFNRTLAARFPISEAVMGFFFSTFFIIRFNLPNARFKVKI